MKIISLLTLVLLYSCSKSESPKTKLNFDNDDGVIVFEAVQIEAPNGVTASDFVNIDFASLDFKQRAVQEVILSNSSAVNSIVYANADFDASLTQPFTISSNSCVGTILPRKKCKITISLSNATSLASDQNLTSLFKIKNVDISLTGILKADVTDYLAPVSSISVSPLELNFGAFKTGESRELAVIVKNNGTVSTNPNIESLQNSNVSISSNTCSSLLAARKSCSVKLKYTGATAEVKIDDNLLKIANYQITHSATIVSPSVLEPEIVNIQPLVNAASYSMTQPSAPSGSINFLNSGTVSLSPPIVAVSSDDGIIINSISCLGGLSRSKQCSVNYSLNSALLPTGNSVQTIKLQSGIIASESFSLNLNITAPPSNENYIRNFVSENSFNSAYEYEYGSETFIPSGLMIGGGGGFDVELNSFNLLSNKVYIMRVFVADHSGNFDLYVYGDQPEPINDRISPEELSSSVIGSGYVDRKIVIRDLSQSWIGMWNNSGEGSVVVSKFELIPTEDIVPQKLNGPTNVTAFQNPNGTISLSWDQSPYTDSSVSYTINKKIGGVGFAGGYNDVGATQGTSILDNNTYPVGETIYYSIRVEGQPVGPWKRQIAISYVSIVIQ